MLQQHAVKSTSGVITMKYLLFCTLLFSTALLALPRGSMLYPLPDGALHVRLLQPVTLNSQHTDIAVVLISGPNEHFFADSGFFALLQPVLAQQHRTYAVDRQSSGFSSDTPTPSYRKFASDLAQVLPQLPAKKFLLVSFASGSITARLLADNPAIAPHLHGLLLLDPDVPTQAALELYNAAPADWYRAHLDELLPELAKGVWNDRTARKIDAELAQIRQLVPPAQQSLTDWDYLQQLQASRLPVNRQQARAIEIAQYQADLAAYTKTPWQQSVVPVSVVDSDFEAPLIAEAKEDQARLQRWRQDGLEFAATLAKNSGGRFVALPAQNHLLMFSHSAELAQLINDLVGAKTKPLDSASR